MGEEDRVSSARQRRRKNRQHKSSNSNSNKSISSNKSSSNNSNGSSNQVLLTSPSSSDMAVDHNIETITTQVALCCLATSSCCSIDVPDHKLNGSVCHGSCPEELLLEASHAPCIPALAPTDPLAVDEVEDFSTLLNSTLQLPQGEAPPPTPTQDAMEEHELGRT